MAPWTDDEELHSTLETLTVLLEGAYDLRHREDPIYGLLDRIYSLFLSCLKTRARAAIQGYPQYLLVVEGILEGKSHSATLSVIPDMTSVLSLDRQRKFLLSMWEIKRLNPKASAANEAVSTGEELYESLYG